MDHRHRSLFAYNITKPYPFRWFTPVTIVGAVVLTALFSWLNYASNGFEMVVSTSSDPNSTIADPGVLKGLPHLLTGKYKPICQPASIAMNSIFFTNNTGLQYQLLEVLQIGEETRVMPALTYSNNVLEDCQISTIQLELSSSDRTGVQLALKEYGTVVRTYASCNISSPDGQFLPGIVSNVPSTKQ